MAVNDIKDIYASLGISSRVLNICEDVLGGLDERFREIDRTSEYCQLKVLKAFQKNNVNIKL